METPPACFRVNVFAEHLGGRYACRWFGHRVDIAVWCGNPGCGTFDRRQSAAAHFGSASRAPTMICRCPSPRHALSSPHVTLGTLMRRPLGAG